MTRSRGVEATEGQTQGHELKSRKRRRQAARQSQEEETEVFLNAPRLKTNPDGACELRPAKRRRIRSQLVLPDGWEVYKKQIFRVRPAPEVCRDTFAKAPAAQVSSLTGVSGGGIFTSSSPSSAGSAGVSSSALAAPSSSIFTGGGGSSGGIFSLSASSGAATVATSAASSGSIFGTAGSTFGSAGSIFGQGAGAAPAGAAFGAAASAQSGPSMFAQAFQQSRPGPGAARRRRR
ncbi:unnamed protein product [Symbiodinium sp. CCMP2456]|nr:unnamed protein product [Symbiodinium sp. CCMP2456]